MPSVKSENFLVGRQDDLAVISDYEPTFRIRYRGMRLDG